MQNLKQVLQINNKRLTLIPSINPEKFNYKQFSVEINLMKILTRIITDSVSAGEVKQLETEITVSDKLELIYLIGLWHNSFNEPK